MSGAINDSGATGLDAGSGGGVGAPGMKLGKGDIIGVRSFGRRQSFGQSVDGEPVEAWMGFPSAIFRVSGEVGLGSPSTMLSVTAITIGWTIETPWHGAERSRVSTLICHCEEHCDVAISMRLNTYRRTAVASATGLPRSARNDKASTHEASAPLTVTLILADNVDLTSGSLGLRPTA